MIENKIFAPLQENQLKRYGEWLAQTRQKSQFPHQLLIYLTLDGRPIENAGEKNFTDYTCLSYARIRSCLESVTGMIKASRVLETVRQYTEAISSLLEGEQR